MLKGKKIAIIGGGTMGEVIAGAVVSSVPVATSNVTVTDVVRQRLDLLQGTYNVNVTSDNRAAVKNADIVILAVKPQSMGDVLEGVKDLFDGGKLVISIAAGIPIRFIEGIIGEGMHIVRAMPNTPVLVGQGATALAPGRAASDEDLAIARSIFDVVGITEIVKEDLIDAVTGVSGSGPAYFFIIADSLAKGGVLMGLNRDIAFRLAAQTMLGSAKLALESGKHAMELRDMVTSPGGTTIAGIQALEEGRLRATLMKAVEAATLKSKELGKGK